MILSASNLEKLEKMAALTPGGKAAFEEINKAFQAMGAAPSPLPTKEMEGLFREWLAAMGAVPKKDFDELKEKYDKLKSEREKLRETLEGLSGAAPGEVPELLKPWAEFARKAGEANLEIMDAWRKAFMEAGQKDGKGGSGGGSGQ